MRVIDTNEIEVQCTISPEESAQRHLCATVIIHALREFTRNEEDATSWLLDSDLEDDQPKEDGITFAYACSILELSPYVIRDYINNLDEDGLYKLSEQLKRRKSDIVDDESEGAVDIYNEREE